MKFKITIPMIKQVIVDAAKRMIDRYPSESDEHRVASSVIDLSDDLKTLSDDLGKAQGDWNDPR